VAGPVLLRRCAFCWGRLAGGCPACNSLSFASPKESKQRKGDPGSCVPSLRCGQPAVLGPAGVKNNSPSAQTSFCPDPSGPALLGASTRGWGGNTKTEHRRIKDTPWRVLVGYWSWYPNSDFPVLAGPSSADGGGRSGRSCLSRRRVLRTAAGVEQRRLPRSAAKGTQTAGRLFFGDFLLAKQKKVTCRRATPGQLPSAKRAKAGARPASTKTKPAPHNPKH
jgi:hypothetical protein